MEFIYLFLQRVRAHEIDVNKREQMLRELKIIIQTQKCEDIVRFYGALFQDVNHIFVLLDNFPLFSGRLLDL